MSWADVVSIFCRRPQPPIQTGIHTSPNAEPYQLHRRDSSVATYKVRHHETGCCDRRRVSHPRVSHGVRRERSCTSCRRQGGQIYRGYSADICSRYGYAAACRSNPTAVRGSQERIRTWAEWFILGLCVNQRRWKLQLRLDWRWLRGLLGCELCGPSHTSGGTFRFG